MMFYVDYWEGYSMEELLQSFLVEFKAFSTFEEVETPEKVYGKDAFQNLYQYVIKNEDKMPAVLDYISESLCDMDILKTCCAAHFCGSLLHKVGLRNCGIPIVDAFVKITALCCQYLEKTADLISAEKEELSTEQIESVDLEKLFQQAPDCVRAYKGCRLITLAVMDVITKDSVCRFHLRQYDVYSQLEYLQDYIDNIYYVTWVYYACPCMPLVVLNPVMKKGFLAEINDLTYNFHLFTLLEAELYQKELAQNYGLRQYKFNREIYEIAIGKKFPKKAYTIYAHQMYYTYDVLVADTDLNMLGQKGLSSLVWGEMSPEEIPKINGKAVIVMDYKEMFASRSWDEHFISSCHSSLNPYFKVVRELTVNEVNHWIEEIKNKK